VTVETADDFATQLFEEAKAFLEKFCTNREDGAAVAYLHAALLLGYCSLEAHVNNVAADFADRSEFDTLEKSILTERDVALKDGEFTLTRTLKFYRLEERFEFLCRRFQEPSLDKSETWWNHLKAGLEIRNAVTHPRTPRKVTEKDVTDALNAILEAVDVLFQAVYKKPYPGKGRRLESRLEL
jgi:hypothetical protein